MPLEIQRMDAVLFDMDGLMIDSERIAMNALVRAMAEFGFEWTREDHRLLIGRTDVDCQRLMRERFGPDFPDLAVDARSSALVRAEIEQSGMPVKPGLLELLDAVQRHGLRRAVASSSSRAHVLRKLAEAGVLHRFEAVVGGDEVPQGKPAPDLFLQAATRLNVDPTRCLALEDSANGVRAAHAAGCQVIMVPDLVPADQELRRLARIVESLSDVIDLLPPSSEV